MPHGDGRIQRPTILGTAFHGSHPCPQSFSAAKPSAAGKKNRMKEQRTPLLSRNSSARNRSSSTWAARIFSGIIIHVQVLSFLRQRKAPREFIALSGGFPYAFANTILRTINLRRACSLPPSGWKQQCRYALLWCRFALDIVLAPECRCSGL